MTQAEEMRLARNNEAKELIGTRVGTAKAIFTQNSSSGQMHSNKAAPAKPVRNSIAQRINSLNSQQQETTSEESSQRSVLPKTIGNRVVSTIVEADVTPEVMQQEIVTEAIVQSAPNTRDKLNEPAAASEYVNVSSVAALPPVKVKILNFTVFCQCLFYLATIITVVATYIRFLNYLIFRILWVTCFSNEWRLGRTVFRSIKRIKAQFHFGV